MEAATVDSKRQLKSITTHLKNMDRGNLYSAMETLAISLVMGMEQYLRRFPSADAIPLLADVCDTFVSEARQADLIEITLRALSLIMEHVPSSYDGAQQFHVSLMQIASQAMHKALCEEWQYTQLDKAGMIEECLRVMRFVSKDDLTGTMIQHALVGDLLTLCISEEPLVARQGLETLLMLCSKVVMPSELEKPASSMTSGLLSLFKTKKKSSSSHADPKSSGSAPLNSDGEPIANADHPIVIHVENVIAPLLLSLVEKFSSSLAAVPEHWTQLELSIQCLGSLIERALLCHRPHTGRLLAFPTLPKMLFSLINCMDANVTLEPSIKADRILFCETTLSLLVYCNRAMMAESLLLPESKIFYKRLLEDNQGDITSLLDDPFPRAVIATRSTQRRDKDHITSISAIQLFVLACPSVPPDAFGLKPKFVLPVHQWLWEDELRHNNNLVEEQCVSLETSFAKLDANAEIVVHLKRLPVDLHSMTMARGVHGGHRNLSRSYAPFVYHFVDDASLRPPPGVKDAGPGTAGCGGQGSSPAASTSSASKRSKSKSVTAPAKAEDSVILNRSVSVPASHMELAEQYFMALCTYAKTTSGQMAKQVATCACASVLQLMLLASTPKRFTALMGKAVLPMCEMFLEALISADKATKAVVLTMITWMLHCKIAEPCEFSTTVARCGLLEQLDVLAKATLLVRDKPTRTASLAEKAETLHKEILAALGKRQGPTGTSMSADALSVKRVLQKLQALCNDSDTHEGILADLMKALASAPDLTAYEVQQLGLSSVLFSFLLGGAVMDDAARTPLLRTNASSSSFGNNGSFADCSPFSAAVNCNASIWAQMISAGKPVADILHKYVNAGRLRALVVCGARCPGGFRQMVHLLSSTLVLHQELPLVESIVSGDRVVCKPPLHAFKAMADISPLVALCGEAGRRIAKVLVPKFDTPAATEGSPSNAKSKCGDLAAAAAKMAKECCMKGHRLRDVPQYTRLCKCDKCKKEMSSGRCCRTCNFDLCRECYPKYLGDIELVKKLITMARNRAHLCTPVGDVERWFRTGSTSCKGTQTAPTTQSSLHNLERFTTRSLDFLKRFVNVPADAIGAAGSGPYTSAEVALGAKLTRLPSVVRRLVYNALQSHATRGALLDEGTAIIPEAAAQMDAEVKANLTAEELTRANALIAESLEDRYMLYRPSCGLVPYQETFLNCLYKQAFAKGEYAVLVQLENCLLRLEGVTEQTEASQKLTWKPETVTALAPLSALVSGDFSQGPKSAPQKVAKTPNSPLTGTTPASTPLSSSTKKHKGMGSPFTSFTALPEGLAGPGQVVMTATEKVPGEMDNHCISKDQRFVFHHFERDSAQYCSCGVHARDDLHREELPAMHFTTPGISQRPDMLVLVLLHTVLFQKSQGGITFLKEAHAIFGEDGQATAFVNTMLTSTVVKCLEASALRVGVLSPRYALPRWAYFVLTEARFLLPTAVREQVARFLAYGAQRSLTQHMRLFREQRADRAIPISPGEWARVANHKFSVSREEIIPSAFTVLRKSADARLPISIEFKGDVGVGQGPTAQFYTLLATEVSKTRLQLWRGSGDKEDAPPLNDSLRFEHSADMSSLVGSLSAPPSTLPPRRSSKTPTTTPPRTSGSVGNFGASLTSPRRHSASTRCVDRVHHVPSTTRRNRSSSGAFADDSLMNAPPEGLFPRAAHPSPLWTRVEPETQTASPAADETKPSRNTTASQKGRAKPSLAISVSPNASMCANELHTLVDRNVGLLKDYVVGCRGQAEAYYAVGAALGRAFVDHQVFPLQLSPAIGYFLRRGVPPYELRLPEAARLTTATPPQFPIDIYEIPLAATAWVDEGVARSLASLADLDDATLCALDLPFTLPGDDSFALLPGGGKETVNKKNVHLYCRRVAGALLYESVAMPMRFLVMGFSDVVPRESLMVMEDEELMRVLCGDDRNANEKLWTRDDIRSVLIGDHGYQNDSPQLEMLANVLGDRLTAAEQRCFLAFCTGCPRLPIGGVRSLGAITVVKRSNAFAEARDAAVRAEAAANAGSAPADGDMDEDDAFPMPGFDHGAASEMEMSSSRGATRTDSKKPAESSVGAGNTGDDGRPSSDAVIDLPDSEWALPSVNTCFRYLKLPPYPTEELLYKKLVFSITQTGGTFELS